MALRYRGSLENTNTRAKNRHCFGAWISNQVHIKLWDIIPNPYSNANGGLNKEPFKLGYKNDAMWFVIYSLIKIIHLVKEVPVVLILLVIDFIMFKLYVKNYVENKIGHYW